MCTVFATKGNQLMTILTTREVADRLGVTPRAVQAWIKKGKFPNAYKLDPDGRTSPYRIPESDVVSFEERRTNQVKAQE